MSIEGRRTALRQILSEKFSDDELQNLCYDLGIDYENLPGDNKSSKARELVEYLERRDMIPKLIAVGKEQRSDINWNSVLETEDELTLNSAQVQSEETSEGRSGCLLGLVTWYRGLAPGAQVVLIAAIIGLFASFCGPVIPIVVPSVVERIAVAFQTPTPTITSTSTATPSPTSTTPPTPSSTPTTTPVPTTPVPTTPVPTTPVPTTPVPTTPVPTTPVPTTPVPTTPVLTNSGRIIGTVIDELSGQPLTEFVVDLVVASEDRKCHGTVGLETVTTDSDGDFDFVNVPPGVYEVGVLTSSTPYRSSTYCEVIVDANETVRRDFGLTKAMTIIYPPMNGTVSTSPAFSWEPFPSAAGYLLIISEQTQSGGTYSSIYERWLTGTSHTLSQPLKPNQNYLLQVKAMTSESGSILAEDHSWFSTQ